MDKNNIVVEPTLYSLDAWYYNWNAGKKFLIAHYPKGFDLRTIIEDSYYALTHEDKFKGMA